MIRVHNFKIYPSASQVDRLNDWLWASRRLWNAFLEQRRKAYERRGEYVSYAGQSARIKDWRKADSRMADCPFNALRGTAQRLDRAFQAFFRRCKNGEKPGFPRFKNRARFRSLEFNQPERYLRDGRAWIPKIGLVRCRGTLPTSTDIRCMRIIRKASGWYASIAVEDGQAAPDPVPIESAVGVDMGLNSFAVDSEGNATENPRYYRRAQDRLARLQRRLCRKQKGSRNRRKYSQRVARAHERVKNARQNFLHHESKRLVQTYDLIAIEDLTVKGLARTRMAKSINDAGWSTFASMLAYKAESAGKRVVKVNPAYTSQMCSACGSVERKSLSVRVHRCSCGFVACRDHNAAINILNYGLRAVGADVTPVEELASASPVTREGQLN